jgi:hypothetical protein
VAWIYIIPTLVYCDLIITDKDIVIAEDAKNFGHRKLTRKQPLIARLQAVIENSELDRVDPIIRRC